MNHCHRDLLSGSRYKLKLCNQQAPQNDTDPGPQDRGKDRRKCYDCEHGAIGPLGLAMKARALGACFRRRT